MFPVDGVGTRGGLVLASRESTPLPVARWGHIEGCVGWKALYRLKECSRMALAMSKDGPPYIYDRILVICGRLIDIVISMELIKLRCLNELDSRGSTKSFGEAWRAPSLVVRQRGEEKILWGNGGFFFFSP